VESPAEDSVDRGVEGERVKSRFTVQGLLADRRCRRAVLDFLSTTDVGRLVPAEEDAGSDVSERERREREEKRSGDGGAGCRGGIGCRGGATAVSTHAPLSWHPQMRIRGRDTISSALPFGQTLFLCDFLGAHHTFLGQA